MCARMCHQVLNGNKKQHKISPVALSRTCSALTACTDADAFAADRHLSWYGDSDPPASSRNTGECMGDIETESLARAVCGLPRSPGPAPRCFAFVLRDRDGLGGGA